MAFSESSHFLDALVVLPQHHSIAVAVDKKARNFAFKLALEVLLQAFHFRSVLRTPFVEYDARMFEKTWQSLLEMCDGAVYVEARIVPIEADDEQNELGGELLFGVLDYVLHYFHVRILAIIAQARRVDQKQLDDVVWLGAEFARSAEN